ncbi:MAG: hypothetical protein GX778_06675 [Erysipelothrix sp.]|nr:hypothetical protein [Erysipelothrix sp.]
MDNIYELIKPDVGLTVKLFVHSADKIEILLVLKGSIAVQLLEKWPSLKKTILCY